MSESDARFRLTVLTLIQRLLVSLLTISSVCCSKQADLVTGNKTYAKLHEEKPTHAVVDGKRVVFVPIGAFGEPNGMVLAIGVRNVSSEPVVLLRELMIDEATWSVGSSEHGYGQRLAIGSCLKEKWHPTIPARAPFIPPGGDLVYLFRIGGGEDPGEGNAVDVLASIVIGSPLERVTKLVKTQMLLRLSKSLSKQYNIFIGAESASGNPFQGDSQLPVRAFAYKLFTGTVLIIGIENNTLVPLEMLSDAIDSRLEADGRLIWAMERQEPPIQWNCAWRGPVVLPGAIRWTILQFPYRVMDDVIGQVAVFDIEVFARFRQPLCGAELSVQKSMSVTVQLAEQLTALDFGFLGR